MPKDVSPQRPSPTKSAPSTSLRAAFLRKRRKQAVDTAEQALPPTPLEDAIPVVTPIKADKKKKGKKDAEIDSCAEMLEDISPQQHDSATNVNNSLNICKVRMNPELHIIEPESRDGSGEFEEVTLNTIRYDKLDVTTPKPQRNIYKPKVLFQTINASTYVPLTTIACLSAILLMPIHDFIRGIVATFLGVVTLDTLLRHISNYISTTPAERTTFKIPDYNKLPILEIPAAKEQTIFKSYTGWMNEVNTYDPNEFHISMSKSVYVKLDGTILLLSTTTARIPKKVLWNEPEIDATTLNFIEHRIFDLEGCRVDLLPLGLAKKRYFNRKYPIQLIIRSGQEKRLDQITLPFSQFNGNASKLPATPSGKDANDPVFLEAKSTNSLTSLLDNNAKTTNNTIDTQEERSTNDADMDFASTVLNADLQMLQEIINPDAIAKKLIVPSGDEVRLLLFARCDREKEDWYRRFIAASTGEVHEQNLRLPNIKLINNSDLQLTADKAKTKESLSIDTAGDDNKQIITTDIATTSATIQTDLVVKEKDVKFTIPDKIGEKESQLSYTKIQQASESSLINEPVDNYEINDATNDDETFEGLIMSSCVARNPVDYVNFMSNYQKACRQSNIPVFNSTYNRNRRDENRKNRRARRQGNELWKGINQSLYLGPSGSIVWANVLIGRVIYSCLHDSSLKLKLQDLLQRKLSCVKLPSFMENIIITGINLGEVAPLIHRISQPLLDERGTWLDADITYEGLCHITVTTKLNLLRLKKQTRPITPSLAEPITNATTNIGNIANGSSSGGGGSGSTPPQPQPPPIVNEPFNNIENENASIISINSQNNSPQQQQQQTVEASFSNENLIEAISSSAIFDSDAESLGDSSTESENTAASDIGQTIEGTTPNEGNARRLFKIVNRFTASNLFQYATEISYVQRAMESMSANITLRVDLRGLVARGVINLPPPPSDRVWLAFRGPPRLWLTAKPTVGDKTVDWSIVTNVIESKLCEQVNRHLVYPNMVDVTIPFLGQPTYKE